MGLLDILFGKKAEKNALERNTRLRKNDFVSPRKSVFQMSERHVLLQTKRKKKNDWID